MLVFLLPVSSVFLCVAFTLDLFHAELHVTGLSFLQCISFPYFSREARYRPPLVQIEPSVLSLSQGQTQAPLAFPLPEQRDATNHLTVRMRGLVPETDNECPCGEGSPENAVFLVLSWVTNSGSFFFCSMIWVLRNPGLCLGVRILPNTVENKSVMLETCTSHISA